MCKFQSIFLYHKIYEILQNLWYFRYHHKSSNIHDWNLGLLHGHFDLCVNIDVGWILKNHADFLTFGFRISCSLTLYLLVSRLPQRTSTKSRSNVWKKALKIRFISTDFQKSIPEKFPALSPLERLNKEVIRRSRTVGIFDPSHTCVKTKQPPFWAVSLQLRSNGAWAWTACCPCFWSRMELLKK